LIWIKAESFQYRGGWVIDTRLILPVGHWNGKGMQIDPAYSVWHLNPRKAGDEPSTDTMHPIHIGVIGGYSIADPLEAITTQWKLEFCGKTDTFTNAAGICEVRIYNEYYLILV